jgi:hypothetical protein
MLFLDVPRLGNLDIKLGKDSSVPIFQTTNPLIESIPKCAPIEEVMTVYPFDPPKSILKKDVEHFKEDDS